MNKYTIYCTEEQTRKALELGAPINFHNNAYVNESVPHYVVGEYGNYKEGWILYFIPTAEQMIGYLEEQGMKFDLDCFDYNYTGSVFYYRGEMKKPFTFSLDAYSRKEVTLAAIDAALDYLTNNKK